MNNKNELTSLFLKFREIEKAKSAVLELNDRLSEKSKQLETASEVLKNSKGILKIYRTPQSLQYFIQFLETNMKKQKRRS